MRIKEVLGMGSVEDRGKEKYRLKLSIQYTNGKKERISKTISARNKTEAKHQLDDWRMELMLRSAEYVSKQLTVNEMLDDYLKYCANNKNLVLRTLEGYRKIANRYLRPTLGGRFVDEITPEKVEEFFNELQKSGGVDNRPLSGNTCKRILSVLHPMINRAIFHQYILVNPCDPITMPRSDQKEIMVLSKDEIEKMLALLLGHPDQRFAMVVRLALLTGCRRGELCALRWKDVDFEQSTIHIRHSLAEVAKRDAPDGRTEYLKDTKNHENRNLSIDAETMKALREHKTRQSHQLLNNEIKQNERIYVFANAVGEPYCPSNLTKDFEAFVFKHAFKIRFHDLRHTHASILIMSGESIVAVSKRLGHKKVSTTLDVYSHLMPGDDRAIAEKLGELFNERPSTEHSLKT